MILGVDPGLANVGWARLDDNWTLTDYGHIETAKSHGAGDMQRRLDEVVAGLLPGFASASAVVVEWPAGGQAGQAGRTSLAAARQVVACAAAVYGLARGRGIGVLRPAPVTWRAALADHWGCERTEAAIHGVILDSRPKLAALKKKSRPHILDAVGLAEYGLIMITKGTKTR